MVISVVVHSSTSECHFAVIEMLCNVFRKVPQMKMFIRKKFQINIIEIGVKNHIRINAFNVERKQFNFIIANVLIQK